MHTENLHYIRPSHRDPNTRPRMNHQFVSKLAHVDHPVKARTARYHDPATGLTLAVADPATEPDLWSQYLSGAIACYRAFGVEEALELDEVRSGAGTSLFCCAIDDRRTVVAGLRQQGPYITAAECHAVREWNGQQGLNSLLTALDSRISDGIMETKMAWVDPARADCDAIATLLCSLALATLRLSGTRYLMATAADFVLRRWESSGGRVDPSVPATPYPDERYKTRLMWWDSLQLRTSVHPQMYAAMTDVADSLVNGAATNHAVKILRSGAA